MSSSLIPACIDALVGLLGAALPALQLLDGAVLQNEEQFGLTVGANLDQSEFSWEQSWAGLGHVYRDERFQIPCVLWGRSGDTTVKTVRDALFGYFATIESTLRSNHNLGLATNSIRAQITPADYSQPQTPEGVLCRIDFTITVDGRI